MEKATRKPFPISAVFLLAFLIPGVSAWAIMQLIPPIQEVKVQRGYSETFTITIKNLGDEDVPCTFVPYDMDIREDGAPFIADSTQPYDRGCGSWITLDPPEAIVKATETLTLVGTISAPKNAEGGYYALIQGNFVGTTIPLTGERANIKEGSSIALGSQAVVAVLITVPSSRCKPVLAPDTLLVYPKGESAGRADFGTSAESKGWKVVLPVRNDGNIHTRVSGTASFYSEGGTRIESAPLKAGRGYVFPGKVRDLVAQGDNALSDGYYMIRLNLSTEEGMSWTNSLPFAIYEGKVYPGSVSDELASLIRASAPGFSFREPFMEKQVTPGGASYLTVQVVNVISDTLVLYPRKLEWNLTPIGQIWLGKEATVQPRSCSSWIEFMDDKLVLPPGRRGSLRVKVNAPKDAGGEYYSAVILDPEESRNRDLPGEFMSARSQLLALRTSADLEYQVDVSDITIKTETSPDLTLYRFGFKVKNTGNIHCFATGNLGLEWEAAEGVYKSVGLPKEFGGSQAYILPGGARTFGIDIPDLRPGKYRIILATNYKRETQPIVKYQIFTVD